MTTSAPAVSVTWTVSSRGGETAAYVPASWPVPDRGDVDVDYGDVRVRTVTPLVGPISRALGIRSGTWSLVVVPGTEHVATWCSRDSALPVSVVAGVALMLRDPRVDGDGLVAGAVALIAPRIARELYRRDGVARARRLRDGLLLAVDQLLREHGDYPVGTCSDIWWGISHGVTSHRMAEADREDERRDEQVTTRLAELDR